ncbi:hypothetical protein [Amaricoccus sp.]|uniref:hypothetical protein n=1 Tax=Amaricoccus sp. TaxID=1872485 RepID=UPI00260ABD3E|nr:hypothetical protein [Amaricoccus sp.]HRO12127.1 hypothetical protein [Amaricoccus sp.]
MFSSIKAAIARSREQAAARRAVRLLEGQSDHLLADMGLSRETLFSSVVGPKRH